MPKTLMNSTPIVRQSQAGRVSETPKMPPLPSEGQNRPGTTSVRADAANLVEYSNTQMWDNDSKNHKKTYNVLLFAARLRVDQQFAYDLVVYRIAEAGGIVDFGEIERQLKRAYEYSGMKLRDERVIGPKNSRSKNRTAKFSPSLLKQCAGKVQIVDPAEFLRQRSPLRPASITAAGFIEQLYEPEERVIVFRNYKSQGQAIVHVGHSKPDSIPTCGPDGVWFLVQPVDGKYHRNPREDKWSRRSEESVVRWPYLVLESDEADADEWLKMLIQLPLAIVAIYRSGGRSIHALVRVDAPDKRGWDAIKERIASALIPVGADPGALSAVRLSRLPQCKRGENLQELLYLNPQAEGTPIYTATGGAELSK